ncbi:hypothetical protein Ancab_008525 [Ancistrocladus abbreviatus]
MKDIAITVPNPYSPVSSTSPQQLVPNLRLSNDDSLINQGSAQSLMAPLSKEGALQGINNLLVRGFFLVAIARGSSQLLKCWEATKMLISEKGHKQRGEMMGLRFDGVQHILPTLDNNPTNMSSGYGFNRLHFAKYFELDKPEASNLDLSLKL